jgi:hypothetical protein
LRHSRKISSQRTVPLSHHPTPKAPVIKRAGRRRHADYSEAELAEWEIKKKAKKAAVLNTTEQMHQIRLFFVKSFIV